MSDNDEFNDRVEELEAEVGNLREMINGWEEERLEQAEKLDEAAAALKAMAKAAKKRNKAIMENGETPAQGAAAIKVLQAQVKGIPKEVKNAVIKKNVESMEYIMEGTARHTA